MRLHPTGQFDNRAAEYRHIGARPLAAAMGAEIVGVQIAVVGNEQFAEIRDALFRHKMIYFRGQGELPSPRRSQSCAPYRSRWEAHMVVAWDNRLCVHQAYNDYQGHRREMYRTTVGGEKPM